jgi:hypothetical protein
MAETRGVWVYAVTGTAGVSSPGAARGVAGGPVRAVTEAGLTAIVEDVPLDAFGESALRRNLEDLAWLETAARAHHRVIDAAARDGPVVPMRLATVYRGEEGVRAALADRAADFRGALSRIGTQREWGVKAYAVPPRTAAPPAPGTPPPASAPSRASARPPPGTRPPTSAPSPASAPSPVSAASPADAPSGPPAPGAGAAYLRRRREQISGQEEARRATLEAARAVHAELSRLAAQTRLHPPQAPQLSGNSDQMILNAAYLLDGERRGELAALVTALAEQHPSLRLELTGPWPPYSFAGLDEGKDGAQ